jgi:hypothetical protein
MGKIAEAPKVEGNMRERLEVPFWLCYSWDIYEILKWRRQEASCIYESEVQERGHHGDKYTNMIFSNIKVVSAGRNKKEAQRLDPGILNTTRVEGWGETNKGTGETTEENQKSMVS